MSKFPCPYFRGEIELSEERESHIAEHHPDLLPEYRERMIETIKDPDEIRRSKRFGNALMFSRWFKDLRGGKHVVVVIVSELGTKDRHWVVTAYIARKLTEGEIEWKKS